MAREMAWVRLFCRGSGCGAMFYICGSCYRGQVYCGERCRRRMRRNQMRLAIKASAELPNADVVFNGFPCSAFRSVVFLEFKAHLIRHNLDTKTCLFVIY